MRALLSLMGMCGLVMLLQAIQTKSPPEEKRQKLNLTKTQAMSNLKQICIATMLYSVDYDDVLPYALDTETVFAVTYPYLKNKSILKSLNPNGGKIEFNLNLGGVDVQKLRNSNLTPLFVDSKPWPGNLRLVGFVDTHIEYASSTRWSKIEPYLLTKIAREVKTPLKRSTIQSLWKVR